MFFKQHSNFYGVQCKIYKLAVGYIYELNRLVKSIL